MRHLTVTRRVQSTPPSPLVFRLFIDSFDASIVYMISRIFYISVRIVRLNFIQFVVCFVLGFILTGSHYIPFLAVQIAPIRSNDHNAVQSG